MTEFSADAVFEAAKDEPDNKLLDKIDDVKRGEQ